MVSLPLSLHAPVPSPRETSQEQRWPWLGLTLAAAAAEREESLAPWLAAVAQSPTAMIALPSRAVAAAEGGGTPTTGKAVAEPRRPERAGFESPARPARAASPDPRLSRSCHALPGRAAEADRARGMPSPQPLTVATPSPTRRCAASVPLARYSLPTETPRAGPAGPRGGPGAPGRADRGDDEPAPAEPWDPEEEDQLCEVPPEPEPAAGHRDLLVCQPEVIRAPAEEPSPHQTARAHQATTRRRSPRRCWEHPLSAQDKRDRVVLIYEKEAGLLRLQAARGESQVERLCAELASLRTENRMLHRQVEDLSSSLCLSRWARWRRPRSDYRGFAWRQQRQRRMRERLVRLKRDAHELSNLVARHRWAQERMATLEHENRWLRAHWAKGVSPTLCAHSAG